MAATYLSAAVRDELTHPQAELNAHLVVASNNRCNACGHEVPCARRDELGRVFARYGLLPKRLPGLAGEHFHFHRGRRMDTTR